MLGVGNNRAQESCSIYVSDKPEYQGARPLWIRIIYITERLLQATLYC